MKTRKISIILLLVITLLLSLPGISVAALLGTAFTYQGRLIDSNDVADGLYDFQFSLHDANSAGNQLGSDVNEPDIDVIDGYFTVVLDFNDANAFNGNARWLEIGVRPGVENDPCAYTPLVPRQEVTPTPYALYAKTADGDGDWTISGSNIYLTVSGNVGIGDATPSEKLDVTGHINSSESYKLDGQTVLSNTGTNNIFVGKDAGASITTGIRNSAVGNFALADANVGIQNSAMGYEALKSNTTGHYNSAMGYAALKSNTTGYYNSAVGNYALQSNTTGYYNSAMGYAALLSNTTGGNNSAIGSYALRLNTTGIRNSAVGNYALQSNTIGGYNSAMGSYALYWNTTGLFNSALGYRAGYSNSTGSGNVFLGFRAGSNETGDNKLYIANNVADANVLIYGDFSTGRVGLGTTSPTANLDINGSTGYDQVRMRTSYTPSSSADGNGNVGDIAWDDDYIYVKTSTGWKRTSLVSF